MLICISQCTTNKNLLIAYTHECTPFYTIYITCTSSTKCNNLCWSKVIQIFELAKTAQNARTAILVNADKALVFHS